MTAMEERVGWTFILVWMFTLGGSYSTPCATFDFPSLNNSVLSTALNATINLPFELKPGPNCSVRSDVTIRLRMSEGGKFGDYCSIRQSDGSCHMPLQENGCNCIGRGRYQLTKTAGRMDGTQWLWTADSQLVQDKILTFNVLYPATVESLTLDARGLSDQPKVVDPGAKVTAVCHWQNGNPPVTARLLDRHGVKMEGSIYIIGQIQHTFPAVSCQDAGLIRCEAPGASHNKTATLLVRCQPEFDTSSQKIQVKFTDSGSRDVQFPVRTHTTTIAQCNLAKLTSEEVMENSVSTEHPPDNSAKCELEGTPPDLKLTVRLDNVRKEDEGQWRLELSNDAGTGHVEFRLQFQKGSITDADSTTIGIIVDVHVRPTSRAETVTMATAGTLLAETGQNDDTASANWIIIGPSAAAAVVVIVIVVIVLIVVRRKKVGRAGRSATGGPFPGRQLPEVPEVRVEVQHASECHRASLDTHDYVDIAELTSKTTEGAKAEHDDYLLPRVRPTGRPESQTESYERPVNPDYVSPKPVYEPLRHLYDRFTQRRIRTSRSLSLN